MIILDDILRNVGKGAVFTGACPGQVVPNPFIDFGCLEHGVGLVAHNLAGQRTHLVGDDDVTRLIARVALIDLTGSVIRFQHGDEVLLAVMTLSHVIGEGIFKMGRFAFLGNCLHIDRVMQATLAEGHRAVAALETDIFLTQVLVGERHPHAQGFAGGDCIGIHIEGEGNVHVAPVTHVVLVGRRAHRFQVILAASEEGLVVILGILGGKFLAQQPQVAHTLAEPHLLAVNVHHLEGTGAFPVLDLSISSLGHLLANLFHALLGGNAEVGADALHDGKQRVDAHGIGLAHLLGQRFHQLLGTGELTLCDILIDLVLPVGGCRYATQR